MGNKETLRQYLTYNKDVNVIEQIFSNLDGQLQYIHSSGYYVSELNSDTIVLDRDGNNNLSFSFSSIAKSNNLEMDVHENVKNLSKLALGAFISIENGFCDYTNLDDNYIRKYFDEMSSYIPNPEYYRSVIVENDTSSYYSEYLMQKDSGGKGNSRQMVKANAYGKMYVQDDEAAFVQIVLYPVLIVTIIAIIAIVSRFF